jgi:hypothetical protein
LSKTTWRSLFRGESLNLLLLINYKGMVMSKLLIILALATYVNADAPDCAAGATQIQDKMKKHGLTAITIDYSLDQQQKASACKDAVVKGDNKLTVNLHQVDGKNQFKVHR